MRRGIALFSAFAGFLVALGLMTATQTSASSMAVVRVYQNNGEAFSKSINADDTASLEGDYIVTTAPLYRAGTTRIVGRESSQLTVIQALPNSDARFHALATFRIRGGKLEVAGSSTFSALQGATAGLAITGGTGAFEGASGTLLIHQTQARTHFTFEIRL